MHAWKRNILESEKRDGHRNNSVRQAFNTRLHQWRLLRAGGKDKNEKAIGVHFKMSDRDFKIVCVHEDGSDNAYQAIKGLVEQDNMFVAGDTNLKFTGRNWLSLDTGHGAPGLTTTHKTRGPFQNQFQKIGVPDRFAKDVILAPEMLQTRPDQAEDEPTEKTYAVHTDDLMVWIADNNMHRLTGRDLPGLPNPVYPFDHACLSRKVQLQGKGSSPGSSFSIMTLNYSARNANGMEFVTTTVITVDGHARTTEVHLPGVSVKCSQLIEFLNTRVNSSKAILNDMKEFAQRLCRDERQSEDQSTIPQSTIPSIQAHFLWGDVKKYSPAQTESAEKATSAIWNTRTGIEGHLNMPLRPAPLENTGYYYAHYVDQDPPKVSSEKESTFVDAWKAWATEIKTNHKDEYMKLLEFKNDKHIPSWQCFYALFVYDLFSFHVVAKLDADLSGTEYRNYRTYYFMTSQNKKGAFLKLLDAIQPDVVCLQEAVDTNFPEVDDYTSYVHNGEGETRIMVRRSKFKNVVAFRYNREGTTYTMGSSIDPRTMV